MAVSGASRTVDPITLASVWNGLIAAAEEVGIAIRSTAFTEAIREGDDFSVGVFDTAGRMVAQGNFSPGHLGAMPFTKMRGDKRGPALAWDRRARTLPWRMQRCCRRRGRPTQRPC